MTTTIIDQVSGTGSSSEGAPHPVARGGTGAALLTDHGVLLGSGTAPITALAPGAARTVLTSQGAGADPHWWPMPWVAVTMFGATGDGATDDTAAIQAAIDVVANAGGGTVYFPKPSSVYKITSPLRVNVDGVFLEGDGFQRSVVASIHNANTSGAHAITFGDPTETSADGAHFNGVGIRDLAITGNALSGDGIHVYNCAIHCNNVYSFGHGRYGLWIIKGWSSFFDLLNVQANGDHQFFSVTALNAVTFLNCKGLSKATKRGFHIGGGAAGSNNITFINPDLEGVDIGVYFDTSTGPINGVQFIGGNWEGNTTAAIGQAATGNLISLVTDGGQFYGSGNGISLVTLYNSTFRSPRLFDTALSVTSDQTSSFVITPRLEGTASISGIPIMSTGGLPYAFRRLTGSNAGLDVNTAQSFFAGAGDELTVVAGMYRFRGQFTVSRSAGTTSHTLGLLFGGTMTVGSTRYHALVSQTVGAVAGAVQSWPVAVATVTTVTVANTDATENIRIDYEGVINITGGGTLIPQYQFSAAPGGVPTVATNGWFELVRQSAASAPGHGTWS